MKVVAIIPARAGSKTIPKKNIMRLGDYPLIAYSIAAAKLSTLIDDIIVSTDSKEIAEIAKFYGADVPFLRPSNISKDDSRDIEFFKHFINFCSENNIKIPDLIVHLSPTVPLREGSIIDDAIKKIIRTPMSTGLRSVHETSTPPQKMFQIDNGYLKGFFPSNRLVEYYNYPRQKFPKSFIPNGQVDIIKPSTFINSTMLHGKNLLAYITKSNPDIDAYQDYEEAKTVLESNRYKYLIDYMNKKYSNIK